MLALPQTMTLADAGETLRTLDDAARRDPGAALAIDAAGVQRFDTSALAVLLEFRRIADAAGRGFEVHNAPPQLAALAALYGVGDLLFGAAQRGDARRGGGEAHPGP